MLNPTVIAIPFFALMIALETFFAVRHERTYDRKDVWTNIALGFGSVGFGFVFGAEQFQVACLQGVLGRFARGAGTGTEQPGILANFVEGNAFGMLRCFLAGGNQ